MTKTTGYTLRKAAEAGHRGSTKTGASGRHQHALWNVLDPEGRWVARLFHSSGAAGWMALPVVDDEIRFGPAMTHPSHFTHRADAFEAAVRALAQEA